MTDNFYINCPAKMNGRDFGIYENHAAMEQELMKRMGVYNGNHRQYTATLQKTGQKAITANCKGCWNSSNVNAKYSLRQDPSTFYQQMMDNNNEMQNLFNKFYRF